MSNPNNPFLPFLTQENNNNNESRNQDKDNNSNTLEEGSSVSAPPPAYEDVVKPGYNYPHTYNPLANPPTNPSYPPPSYPPPPPTVPMTANVNQTNQQPHHPHHPHVNHNNKYGYRVCCCRFSSRGKACCYALIILIVFVILASISIANNSVCKQLILEKETPEDFFVDPQTHTTIHLFEEGSRIRTEGVRIFQNPSSSNQTSVNIRVFTGSSKNVSPQFREDSDDRGNYDLMISKRSGFNLFNIPPHCMIFRIDVYLPPNATIPTIRTDNMNIRVMKSDNDEQYQNIPLTTEDGNIELEAVNATSVNISTDDGNIIGQPSSIRVSNNLSVKTDDGDLNLSLDVTTNSTVSIQTKDGNVKLNVVRIDGSQVNCKVRTEGGRIRVNGEFSNNIFDGTFGTADDRSPASLTITTDDGDVDLTINN